jgi:PleD family two-component response regulator
VTVSAGVAPIQPPKSLAEVLRAADEALYRAKAAGRDCLKSAA